MSSERSSTPTSEPGYLIMDTESVPDGRLIAQVKYPGLGLSETDAIARAQAEARELSWSNSDFLPVTFQIPVAVCIVRVGADYSLQAITRLGEPDFRPRRIVEDFWRGWDAYATKYSPQLKLVTFNGRSFDLPLLELAAFRYGCGSRQHFAVSRNRFRGDHLDLMELLTNYGAYRFPGGLDLLSKLLGKPGKMETTGQEVYQLYIEGKIDEINDYCMYDTLDTYFVFLRTRVLVGELSIEAEHRVVTAAKNWLEKRVSELPGLRQYLENWGDWDPWP